MDIRKYLFWKNENGIYAYKVIKKGIFELMKPYGKNAFEDSEWIKFFSWFYKTAAITDDEYIDFCFISNDIIELPILDYSSSTVSSWNKEEIKLFCNQYGPAETYEMIYSDNKSFICQSGNVLDKNKIKKLYLKCIPEYIDESKIELDTGTEETSIVNKYFIESLKGIACK